MSRLYKQGHDGNDKFYDREQPGKEEIDLTCLQSDVLDALEADQHPEFKNAKNDPASPYKTLATISERKAWLAIYGPLTNVL